MPHLMKHLELDRCPYCNVDKPGLTLLHNFDTQTHSNQRRAFWKTYQCSRCGGVVIAAATSGQEGEVTEIYPKPIIVNDSIPDPAKRYLKQAIETQHSPDGSIMLSASSVDAMLKVKNYKEGTLYNRINKAVEDHLITEEMAEWAHQIRLDANDQRHADEHSAQPTSDDAKKCTEFASALAEFLFVLPARVTRGLLNAESNGST